MSDLPFILRRGVEQILPSAHALGELLKTKKIRVYLGIDPTGNQLHLGHAVVLRKLQQFADAGHHVILLIGNGTVKIGDPTGKDKTRPMLADADIEANFQTWKAQASKILDFSQIEVRRNGDWLDKLQFGDLVRLLSMTTVQQLLERDMFQERLKNNLPIHTHELIYPILQGFDSVVLDVDLEIGGNDQTFNMMVGRQLQRQINNREKFVLSVPLLVGADGRKMGKSLGNFIPLMDPPSDMYGKLMSIADSVLPDYFSLLTDFSEQELQEMHNALKQGQNPMRFKKQLARLLTAHFHSEAEAEAAELHFQRVVQHKELPENIPQYALQPDQRGLPTVDILALLANLSKSEIRRLAEQGAIQLGGQKLIDVQQPIQVGVYKIGKRTFFEVC